MARQGNLSKKERQNLQSDLVARGEEAQRLLNAETDRRIDHAFIQVGIVKAAVKQKGEETVSEMQATADASMDEILSRLRVARLEDVE